jgi:hypothetical protein
MNDFLTQLNQLKGYSYQIWDYSLSHSILTLRGSQNQKIQHHVYIGFADVGYIQFPFSWIGDLYPAPDNELIEILVRVGIGRLDKVVPMGFVKEQFNLYKADSPNCTIYILGKLFEIQMEDEPT